MKKESWSARGGDKRAMEAFITEYKKRKGAKNDKAK
jgi:hypothetical protein